MKSQIRDILQQLKRSAKLAVECPCCGKVIPTSKADLFTEESFSKRAMKYQQMMLESIAEAKDELKSFKGKKLEGMAKTTFSVNLGKILEKFAPILKGFDCVSQDCRGIFEPIDYIVFHGLSKARVTHIEFLDVKSGKSRLTNSQNQIRDVVEAGKVSLNVFRKGIK
jgi:predicted Holliday junction resolvase-like endonuclease